MRTFEKSEKVYVGRDCGCNERVKTKAKSSDDAEFKYNRPKTRHAFDHVSLIIIFKYICNPKTNSGRKLVIYAGDVSLWSSFRLTTTSTLSRCPPWVQSGIWALGS